MPGLYTKYGRAKKMAYIYKPDNFIRHTFGEHASQALTSKNPPAKFQGSTGTQLKIESRELPVMHRVYSRQGLQ